MKQYYLCPKQITSKCLFQYFGVQISEASVACLQRTLHLTQLYTSEGRDPPSDVALVHSVGSYLLSINCDYPQSFSVCKLALVTLVCQQWGQARSDCHIQLQDGTYRKLGIFVVDKFSKHLLQRKNSEQTCYSFQGKYPMIVPFSQPQCIDRKRFRVLFHAPNAFQAPPPILYICDSFKYNNSFRKLFRGCYSLRTFFPNLHVLQLPYSSFSPCMNVPHESQYAIIAKQRHVVKFLS